MNLSCEERKVLELIEGRGRGNPITDAEISKETGIDTRSICDIVKRLLELHEYPIGAAKEKPYGRFIIHSREEFERYLSSLLAMERSIGNRVNALQSAFVKYSKKIEQLRLEV